MYTRVSGLLTLGVHCTDRTWRDDHEHRKEKDVLEFLDIANIRQMNRYSCDFDVKYPKNCVAPFSKFHIFVISASSSLCTVTPRFRQL